MAVPDSQGSKFSFISNVQGKDLVYANFGRDKDFRKLISLGINVTDRIVLTKYGMGGRAGKVKNKGNFFCKNEHLPGLLRLSFAFLIFLMTLNPVKLSLTCPSILSNSISALCGSWDIAL